MTTRRRFTGEFKAKVALEALRRDKERRYGTCTRRLGSGRWSGIFLVKGLKW